MIGRPQFIEQALSHCSSDCHAADERKLTRAEEELNRIASSAALQMKLNQLRLLNNCRGREQTRRVSVIMPTWNRKYVIRRAIDSVLGQSYKNFELIISDDGSSDGTEELVRFEYADDNRIAYLKCDHVGVSHARNIALKETSSPLIAYLDSDNEWHEHYLLLMVNAFEDNEGVDSAYCGIRIVDSVRDLSYCRLKDYDRAALLKRNYIDMNVFMHSRHLYELFGGFNEDLESLEDWELIIRYTEVTPPLVQYCCLANYYINKDYNHLSFNSDLERSYRKVMKLCGHM